MKIYEQPKSDVSFFWDDPLIQSQGGPIFGEDDEYTED